MYRLLITRNELLTSIFPPGIPDARKRRVLRAGVYVCVSVWVWVFMCKRGNVRTLNGAAAAYPRRFM